ncbi:sigma-E factor negative regulatory protein [Polaromonas sp.]|uniref:sigma-E factor negative regulatory protein n=1 Tax=Polaromonas sp. TaxID=1869339 RepID=UPI0027308F81|nr:RseA family anti-sigma factor [Polaromonas sp.]MDP1739903.1 RseA family anti-sigma factor [Polaromonas sp.]
MPGQRECRELLFNRGQFHPATTTMKPKTHNLELISALADGQLSDEDFALALSECALDTETLGRWEAYHLIGDVLRAPGSMTPARDAGFLTRLNARLLQEPALAALPSVALAPASLMPAGDVSAGRWPDAANDSNLRWKLVAGFASMAAVAAIAWNAGGGQLSPAPQLARQEAAQQVLVVSEQGTMVRDARMQELLAAHKQFGGTSALQAPSGFLRNATFETQQSERR